MRPVFLRRVLGTSHVRQRPSTEPTPLEIPGRKSKSTSSEPQPGRASAVVSHSDDALPGGGPNQASGSERDMMREAVLMAPFAFLQAHFPEDGFQYITRPFCREICYTEKNESGSEEVVVTIPGDDTWLFHVARKGAPPLGARVDGIKQGGTVCFVLSTLPPELKSDADMRSDSAFGAVEQALLETIRKLQSADFEGSRPVPDWWLEGCLAMVYVGGKPRLYEYSKAKGLCEPLADTGWMLLKADEELRRGHGLPLQPVLRDAAPEPLSKAQPEPPRERADSSPERAGWSDPFPGVATPDEFALSFYEQRFPKTAENDVTSLYNLREMAMKIPLSFFQGRWPKEEGYDHLVAGFLERDIHYTELRRKEGGGEEEVTVTIPWENTHLYVALDKNRAHIKSIALYAMPRSRLAASPRRQRRPPGDGTSMALLWTLWRASCRSLSRSSGMWAITGPRRLGKTWTGASCWCLWGWSSGWARTTRRRRVSRGPREAQRFQTDTDWRLPRIPRITGSSNPSSYRARHED